jgi:hypothetical protein
MITISTTNFYYLNRAYIAGIRSASKPSVTLPRTRGGAVVLLLADIDRRKNRHPEMWSHPRHDKSTALQGRHGHGRGHPRGIRVGGAKGARCGRPERRNPHEKQAGFGSGVAQGNGPPPCTSKCPGPGRTFPPRPTPFPASGSIPPRRPLLYCGCCF